MYRTMSLDWNADFITNIGDEPIDQGAAVLDNDWSLQDFSWIDPEPGVGESVDPGPYVEANNYDGNLPPEPFLDLLNFGLPLNPPTPLSEQQGGGPAPLNNPSEIESDISNANEAVASSSRKAKSRGPSPAAWSAQKANIKKLYIDEQETLETTMKTMREKFRFKAT
jgi:hypothetical protein